MTPEALQIHSLLEIRGRRECRAPMHPQPRVQSKKAHELVITGSPVHTGIPCAVVLTAYSALSLVNRALLPPSPVRCASIVTRLNASVGASGPHGFAVR